MKWCPYVSIGSYWTSPLKIEYLRMWRTFILIFIPLQLLLLNKLMLGENIPILRFKVVRMVDLICFDI